MKPLKIRITKTLKIPQMFFVRRYGSFARHVNRSQPASGEIVDAFEFAKIFRTGHPEVLIIHSSCWPSNLNQMRFTLPTLYLNISTQNTKYPHTSVFYSLNLCEEKLPNVAQLKCTILYSVGTEPFS